MKDPLYNTWSGSLYNFFEHLPIKTELKSNSHQQRGQTRPSGCLSQLCIEPLSRRLALRLTVPQPVWFLALLTRQFLQLEQATLLGRSTQNDEVNVSRMAFGNALRRP